MKEEQIVTVCKLRRVCQTFFGAALQLRTGAQGVWEPF